MRDYGLDSGESLNSRSEMFLFVIHDFLIVTKQVIFYMRLFREEHYKNTQTEQMQKILCKETNSFLFHSRKALKLWTLGFSGLIRLKLAILTATIETWAFHLFGVTPCSDRVSYNRKASAETAKLFSANRKPQIFTATGRQHAARNGHCLDKLFPRTKGRTNICEEKALPFQKE